MMWSSKTRCKIREVGEARKDGVPQIRDSIQPNGGEWVGLRTRSVALVLY